MRTFDDDFFEELQSIVPENQQNNVNENNVNVKRKKKRRKKNYLLRLLIVIALGVGIYYFLTSPFFDVDEIIVENNRHYTRQQVIHMTDIRVGQNIFGVQINQARDALLLDPYIRSARVMRSLPRGIVITVEERSEAAKVPYADTFIVIDKDGMVLRRSHTPLTLPTLLGLTVKAMDEGSPLVVEETGALTGTLRMLEVMEETGMFFLRIDISNIIIRAYVFENLVCEGAPESIMASMLDGTLEKLLYELYTNGIERGIIYVGGDDYFAFSPMI